MGLGPAAEGGGTARLVHQADHGAQNDEEDQDAHVVAVGHRRYDAAVEHVAHGGLELEVGVEQAARHDADEQRAVNFLGDEGQRDGDDRGQQGPGGVEEAAGRGHIPRAAAGGANVRAAARLTGGVQPVAFHTGTHGAAVRAFDHLGAGFFGRVAGSKGCGAEHYQQHQHHCQKRQDAGQRLSHVSSSCINKK